MRDVTVRFNRWDFTTADLNETFEYTFDANLGWTDVNKKIVLKSLTQMATQSTTTSQCQLRCR